MAYDDGKFGVIHRHWFGLTAKAGGSGDVITFNESESTPVTRFYPKGPIEILKLGVQTLATLGKGEEAFNLKGDGTTLASVIASTTSAPWAIASVAVNEVLDAGSYLTLIASTNACSTGSCAVFIDYKPQPDSTKKWDDV